MSDITRGRHGGNPESEGANPDEDRKARQRALIFSLLCRRPATCDELAVILHTTPNSISGRFTELKRDGKIKKIGLRRTRSGKKAGVYAPTAAQAEFLF